jgi:DUF1680 family protein
MWIGSLSRRNFSLAVGAGSVAAAARGFAGTAETRTVQPVFKRPKPRDLSAVGGFIGNRLRLNAANLERFDVSQYVDMLQSRNYTDWFWIGEQPGKWLEAAIYASASGEQPRLAEKLHSILNRMISLQASDGYLGITDLAVMTPRHPMRGMDPYELYFTLHALLSAADQLDSAPAKQAAMKLGGFFTAKVQKDVAEFWPLPKPVTIAGHEVHYSLEGTLLLDPMMRLYEATGDHRYLQWCQWVVNSIDRWSVVGTVSNLDKVAAGTLPLNQIQPNVHAHTLHMNLLGFLRLYEVTGDTQFLNKTLGAWRRIMENYRYITGGVSVGEGYRDAHNLPNTGQVVETCASMSWLQLNQHLFELTGNQAHLDAIEALIWNHLFAAQTWEGDGFRYHCPLNGWKPAGYFTGPNCCSSSGGRILAMLPTFFYSVSGDTVAINQYVPSTASLRLNGKPVKFQVAGDYPTDSSVQIELLEIPEPAKFTIKLRNPSWCSNPSLKVNGTSVEVQPHSMVSINREWKRGDRLELTLPMETRWVSGEYTNAGKVALTRGPLVFAADTTWTQPQGIAAPPEPPFIPGAPWKEPEPFNSISKDLRPVKVPDGALGPAYETEATAFNGQHVKALLIPFANLGRWYGSEEDKSTELKPDVGMKNGQDLKQRVHPYAVWISPA